MEQIPTKKKKSMLCLPIVLESMTPESKNLESTIPEPKSLKSKILEPKNLESTTPEPKNLESKITEPKNLESRSLDPKSLELKIMDSKILEPDRILIRQNPLTIVIPRDDLLNQIITMRISLIFRRKSYQESR
jgi:hypothetical protein